jgi:hypothetical protein
MMPFFWFWKPPTAELPLINWTPFRQSAFGWLALVAIATLAVLIPLYRWRIMRVRIRLPTDPLRLPGRGWWMSWGLLAVPPTLGLAIAYAISFRERFGNSVAPTWGAITYGLACLLAILAPFQLAIWIPGVTPAKFKYHPRWPWRLRRPKVSSTLVSTKR